MRRMAETEPAVCECCGCMVGGEGDGGGAGAERADLEAAHGLRGQTGHVSAFEKLSRIEHDA